jgi:hypothetical protein
LRANGSRECAPDDRLREAIQLYSSKAGTDLRHFDQAFARSNQLRTRGTDILLVAAREAGVRRFVAQSYCGWGFARSGGAVKTEAEAIRYLERTVTGSSDPEGIVLRYGAFYGPGTGMLPNATLEELRHRRMPLIGDGAGWRAAISGKKRLSRLTPTENGWLIPNLPRSIHWNLMRRGGFWYPGALCSQPPALQRAAHPSRELSP